MINYDPKKLSKFIIYLDMNYLYGWAMSIYLLYGGFKWLKYVVGFDVNSISRKSPIRYDLEIDLEYPDELHYLTRIIHWLQKNLQFLVKCCQVIVKKLQTNTE